MTTSGSVDFSVNRDDIIQAAMEECQAIGAGETISPEDKEICIKRLNMLVKQWSGPGDSKPGMKMWARKYATLFLQNGQIQYSLGPSGDHWAESFVRTTLSAAEAASSTAIDVTSTTGMTAGDYIGIVQDNDSLHWSTISSITTTVNIASGLASAASQGNFVYTYTTKARRPIDLRTIVRRNTDADSYTEDFVVGRLTQAQYQEIPAKNAQGDPDAGYYEPRLVNGAYFVNRAPNSVERQLYIGYISPIEDFDAATDTPDYPSEYYAALVYELAVRLCSVFQRPLTIELARNRDDAVRIAGNLNPEEEVVSFEPGRDD